MKGFVISTLLYNDYEWTRQSDAHYKLNVLSCLTKTMIASIA